MGRRARVSREQVMGAARVAFGERGFEGTTLASIGARLGVSPAALLRHAPTKEALFAAAMEAGHAETGLPSDFLTGLSGGEEPIAVLRRFARALVPFIEGRLGETIAAWMRIKSSEGVPTIQLPFDPRRRSSPPQRILAELTAYMRRASRAGTLSVKSPRAAALAFLGALQAYAFMHRVAQISPRVPLDAYIETYLQVWKKGALAPGRKSR
jgi:AcrR family transcriptional regulator